MTTASPPRDRPAPPASHSSWAMLRLMSREKRDPEPFYDALAARTIDRFAFPVAGQLILDLGSGAGQMSRAFDEAGATTIALDLDRPLLTSSPVRPDRAVNGDAYRLPFADGTFDGVASSNMLEHVPDPGPVLTEIGRVLRPGGWAWVSWTNWYSPWGGHEIVPLHYLGPDRGLRAWRRLRGEPRKNVPFVELWPTHINQVLRIAAAEPTLQLQDAMPRYYPSQRWILRVPGLRELITWNCLLLLERTQD